MKTPEEIKKVLHECDEGYACKRIECPYDDGLSLYNSRCMFDMRKDALAYIQQLEAKIPQWIDIRERSPEKHQWVLFISTGHERVCIGNYHGEGKKGGHYFLACNRLVTAKWWMPTPELPRRSGDGEKSICWSMLCMRRICASGIRTLRENSWTA